jgi:hypothetical protein
MNIHRITHSQLLRDLHDQPAYIHTVPKDGQSIIYNRMVVATFSEDTERITVPLYNPHPGLCGYLQEIMDYTSQMYKTGKVHIFVVDDEGPHRTFFGCALVFDKNKEPPSVNTIDFNSMKGKLFKRRR